MISPEISVRLKNPHESRKLLEEFLTGDEYKSTQISEIRNLIIDKGLWFGPSYDYVDHLFMMEANGWVSIDLEEGLVNFDPAVHTLPKEKGTSE